MALMLPVVSLLIVGLSARKGVAVDVITGTAAHWRASRRNGDLSRTSTSGKS